jgi:hypothetical protein
VRATALLRRAAAALLCALLAWAGAQAATPAPVAPPEHRRGAEQTYLTYPEWFLVHSPAEYADFVRDHTPTRFPFLGHVRQFWSSYGAVYGATRDDYPFNAGYHVMVSVIGVSTTVEYALRAAYETLIGRVSELTATHGMTAEDRLAARVAQDYVDFIRRTPWYEFDFVTPLKAVWTQTGLTGPDALRKWERKYALTTEYGIKAAYAWLIKKATKAAYEEPLPVTAVVVDRLPAGVETELTDLKVLQQEQDGSVLATVPRYDAFKDYAAALARDGATFREIAGNRSVILVSALVPAAWQPQPGGEKILFTQTILTRPGHKRVVVEVPVAGLAATLNRLREGGYVLEHVYDY